MSRGRIARIVLWLAGIGACLAVIAQARFVADLSSFLPEAPTERQRLLVDQLKSGALSRMVLMGIEGATPEARAGLSRSVLIRATRRMAASMDAPWIALNVETAGGRVDDATRVRIDLNLDYAESLGAECATITGDKVAEDMLAFARARR